MVIKNNRLPTEIIMQNLIEQIRNTLLNNEKINDIIKTEDIYIYIYILTIVNIYIYIYIYINFFPPLSTAVRKDFEMKVNGEI